MFAPTVCNLIRVAFPTWILRSDLYYTPVDEQFNTCDITAVIRGEERDGFCDFVRIAHPSQGYVAQELILQLFASRCRAEAETYCKCVYRARADSVDSDLAIFQIDGPRTRERSYSEPWSHRKHSTPRFLWILRPKPSE